MKRKLPKLLKKDVPKEHLNNKEVIIVSNKDDDIIYEDNSTVEEKLNKLFKSSRYIFNIDVVIVTDKKKYDTRIIGKFKNSIITIDNDEIPIIEIRNIIIKK